MPVLAALADDNDAAFFGGLTPQEHAALDRILRSLAAGRGLKTPPVD